MNNLFLKIRHNLFLKYIKTSAFLKAKLSPFHHLQSTVQLSSCSQLLKFFLLDDCSFPLCIFTILSSHLFYRLLSGLTGLASKVMLKILQVRLQQYVNHELPDVRAGFRKGRATRDKITSIRWIIEKAREFQKNIYYCFINFTKAFDCVDHNKLWKILKKMGIPDYLTCLLRNLYAGQEAKVRTGHGTTD